jgi:tripartite ATP-independent transporter DctP family solute receptor
MVKKKILLIVFAAVVTMGLVAGGAQEPGEKEVITLTLADTGSGPNSPLTISGTAWKKAIEEQSNGEIKVNYFTQSQLGGERDLMEGVQAGTIDLYLGSTGVAANFIPEMNVFNLPFLFLNREHCEEVQFGPLGEELVAYMDKAEGIKGLAIGGAGWRMPLNAKRPIKTPADFKGLKWRNMEVPMHMDAYRSMGASPIPIPFTELYTALQLGTADGCEMPPSIAYPMGYHEVTDYYTTLPVLLNADVYVMNKNKWNGLSPEHQQIIKDTAQIAAKALNQGFQDEDEKALKAMEDYGMEVYRIPTSAMRPFIEASQAVWDKYLPQFPKRLQEIALEIKKLGEKY